MTEAAIIVFGPGGIDVARRAQAAIAGSEIPHLLACWTPTLLSTILAGICATCLGRTQSSVYALPDLISWLRNSPTRLRNPP